MVKDSNYITIQGWMVTLLNLRGNELVCYALIYGFSQNRQDYFSGSLTYISEFLGCTKRGVINILDRLEEKGCIRKEHYCVNNVQFCKYQAIAPEFIGGEKTSPGVVKNFHRGGEKSSPNNNIYNNIDININNSKENKEKGSYENGDASNQYEPVTPAIETDTEEDDDLAFPYTDEEKKRMKEERVKCSAKKEKEEIEVSPEMQEVIAEWYQYKKERKQTYTKSGAKAFVKKLLKLSGGDPRLASEIIHESMANNYQGIFPLKNQRPNIRNGAILNVDDLWKNR